MIYLPDCDERRFMSRIAYVNGAYLAHRDAHIHIEDRGYQFGDGVYEVVLVLNGQLIDCEGHLDRLDRSLGEMAITLPQSRPILHMIMRRLIRANHLKTGLVYMQVTRGVAPRGHAFPSIDTPPALVMTVKHLSIASDMAGKKAVSVADMRWARRDIKTIQLLPNCFAKQEAVSQGAYEAIMVMPDGTVSEGASSNVWMVTQDDKLVTRQADHDILNGITRQSLKKLAEERQMIIEERPFSLSDLLGAKEVFVSSATSLATAIIDIDGKQIADGKPGEVATALRADYLNRSGN